MLAQGTTHLLWTGGWDSTYRILDLLLVKKRVVKPYYLIDCGRDSLGVEIRTLRTLRKLILSKFPECSERLLPVEFKEISEIRPNPGITEQFERLRALGTLGDQYDWLARFAEEVGLLDLELSIHVDDKAHAFLQNVVVRESDGDDVYHRLQNKPPNGDLNLFKYFRFPLFDLTKLQMKELSDKHNFGSIMEHTWFCHSPLGRNVTCGTCAPCRYTREEGLSRRISLVGQLRYYLLYRTISAFVDPKELKRLKNFIRKRNHVRLDRPIGTH